MRTMIDEVSPATLSAQFKDTIGQLRQHLRALFYTLNFASMEEVYRALLYGYKVEKVVILGPS